MLASKTRGEREKNYSRSRKKGGKKEKIEQLIGKRREKNRKRKNKKVFINNLGKSLDQVSETCAL